MRPADTDRIELQERIVKFLDDALSEQEYHELNTRLESSDNARRLFNELVLHSQAIAEADTHPQVMKETRSKTAPRRLLLLSITTASVFLVAFFFWAKQRPRELPAIGRLETITGVAGPEGNVTSSMTVFTKGPGSSAKLTYEDGTGIVLDNDTRLTLEGEAGGTLRLLSGHITANVVPRPVSRPLCIHTQQAFAEVLGTELTLEAGADSTALSVQEGVVRLQRLSDSRSVEIQAGQFAVVGGSPSRELGARRSLVVPDEISLSFEDGLPAGWRIGKRVVAEGESNGAFVRAEPVDGQPRGTHFQIYTQNSFYDGMPELFRIHEDTHLHITYRMNAPGWFQVFVGVRPEASSSSERANFLLQPSNEGLQPNQWRTLHVPFSRLRNLQGNFDAAGRSAYFLLFDTQTEDRGLDVQRIWVTRGP